MYFTYLKRLGNFLQRNNKEIYCRFDITDDYIQKDHSYIGKMCVNYGEISFTYGIFTPNPIELWWFCLFEISHFTMFFK